MGEIGYEKQRSGVKNFTNSPIKSADHSLFFSLLTRIVANVVSGKIEIILQKKDVEKITPHRDKKDYFFRS